MKSLGFKKTQGATVANLMKYIALVVLTEFTMDGKKYRGQVKKAFKDTKFCEAMRGQYHEHSTTINTGGTNIQHFRGTSAPRRVRTRGGSPGGRVFREQSYAAYPNEEHLLFSQQNI